MNETKRKTTVDREKGNVWKRNRTETGKKRKAAPTRERKNQLTTSPKESTSDPTSNPACATSSFHNSPPRAGTRKELDETIADRPPANSRKRPRSPSPPSPAPLHSPILSERINFGHWVLSELYGSNGDDLEVNIDHWAGTGKALELMELVETDTRGLARETERRRIGGVSFTSSEIMDLQMMVNDVLLRVDPGPR